MSSARIIDVTLAFAPLAVVPMGLRILAARHNVALRALAAVLFASAFVPGSHGGPALLTLPWIAFAMWLLTAELRTNRLRSIDELGRVAALASLVVAGVWGAISRAGWSPFDIREPITELTSVHFHYAGFATTVIALHIHRSRVTRASASAVALMSIAPPIVAAGFTFRWAVAQVSGAVLLLIAVWTVALLNARAVAPRAPSRVRVGLWISSAAAVAPMILAVSWAAGQHWDVPALSVNDMARTHGILNAYGFVTLGLAAHVRLAAGLMGGGRLAGSGSARRADLDSGS